MSNLSWVYNKDGNPKQPRIHKIATGTVIEKGEVVKKENGLIVTAGYQYSIEDDVYVGVAAEGHDGSTTGRNSGTEIKIYDDEFDIFEYIPRETCTATGGSTTTFIDSNLGFDNDNDLNDGYLIILNCQNDSSLNGKKIKISDYTQSTGTITFAEILSVSILTGDTAYICPGRQVIGSSQFELNTDCTGIDWENRNGELLEIFDVDVEKFAVYFRINKRLSTISTVLDVYRYSSNDGTYNIYDLLSNNSFKTIYLRKGNYLIDTNFTFDSNVKLKFDSGAKLIIGENITLTADYTEIEAPLNSQIFDLSLSGSALDGVWFCEATPYWLGAVGDGITDDYTAFLNCVKYFNVIFIPKNIYSIQTAIDIQDTYKMVKIYGTDRNNTRLDFEDTDGIIVNKSHINISGIYIKGNNSNDSGGIILYNPAHVTNIQIYSFHIGIDLSKSVHVVTSTISHSTIAYCRKFGIKIVSLGASQKNSINIYKNYIVKCGTNADVYTADATIGEGDGMLIQGGYSINVMSCVFEYNTGCGLKIIGGVDVRSDGISIVSAYFERNKYSNFYIDFVSGIDSRNISITGAFYTDAGFTPVANALTNRTLYVYPSNAQVNNEDEIDNFGFSNRNILLRRENFLNAFPMNRLELLSNRYEDNISLYDSDYCFTITDSISGANLYDELLFVDPNHEYLLSYEIEKVNATSTPTLIFNLYNDDTSALITSLNTSLVAAASINWTKKYKKITSAMLSGVKKIRFYINIEGSKPGDCEVYIRNIKVIQDSNLVGLQNTLTWNPGNLVDGAGETSGNITVSGALLGDFVLVSAPYDLQGITCNAYVSATDTINIRIQNETGGAIDLASGSWKVKVLK